jgi:sugar lactone lactonase YvrE
MDEWRDVAGLSFAIGGTAALWALIIGGVGVAWAKGRSQRGLVLAGTTRVSLASRTLLGWADRKPWKFVLSFAAITATITVIVTVAVGVGWLHRGQQRTDRERQFALPFSGLQTPHGVAVDTAGNVYVADTGTNRVLKLAAGSNTQTVLPFNGLDFSVEGVKFSTGTAGVAVDAAGTVYVADTGNHRVVKLAAGSGTQTVLPFTGLRYPFSVAVDTADNVYVADTYNARLVKLAAGSSAQTVLSSSGGDTPDGVAVDTAGTVYTDFSRNACRQDCGYVGRLEGLTSWTKLPSPGPQDYVAVDAAGNVYVTAGGDTGGVKRLARGSNSWTTLPGAAGMVGFRSPGGLAVDTRGNVYVTDNLGPSEHADTQGVALKLPTG